MEFSHKSVLLHESIDALRVKPDGIYCDGTVGGGGHSLLIAEKLVNGRLIATDRDPEAIMAAKQRLSDFSDKIDFVQANFSQLGSILYGLKIPAVDGILLDLGVSSHQFDTPERGFSYNYDAPLDMRMSPEGMTARDYVNSASFEDLRYVLSRYGEEKFASNIASLIVKERNIKPIETTFELSELVKKAIPAAARRKGHHPARKTFQAIRIKVNCELDSLELFLDGALELLKPGGRIAVITFHSLEDRIVKQCFASWARGCTCPPDFPVCVCGKKPRAVLPFKKGIEPTPRELDENPRSRSARLRVAEKI